MGDGEKVSSGRPGRAGPGDRTAARRKQVRHLDEAGHAHFLTFSCYRRMALLGKDRTRWWLVEALEVAREKHRFDLWAWVIMPEHVHLLVWPREPAYRIATILADLKRPVGRHAIDYLQEHAPEFLEQLTVRNRNRTYRRFWQAGPGQDRNVYDPEAAHDIVDYIHHNPVRRGLVLRPEDWPWSSARAWAGWEDVALKVDRTIPGLTELVE
jgi:putative transposase